MTEPERQKYFDLWGIAYVKSHEDNKYEYGTYQALYTDKPVTVSYMFRK